MPYYNIFSGTCFLHSRLCSARYEEWSIGEKQRWKRDHWNIASVLFSGQLKVDSLNTAKIYCHASMSEVSCLLTFHFDNYSNIHKIVIFFSVCWVFFLLNYNFQHTWLDTDSACTHWSKAFSHPALYFLWLNPRFREHLTVLSMHLLMVIFRRSLV